MCCRPPVTSSLLANKALLPTDVSKNSSPSVFPRSQLGNASSLSIRIVSNPAPSDLRSCSPRNPQISLDSAPQMSSELPDFFHISKILHPDPSKACISSPISQMLHRVSPWGPHITAYLPTCCTAKLLRATCSPPRKARPPSSSVPSSPSEPHPHPGPASQIRSPYPAIHA